MLIQYIRNGKRQRIGALVAITNNDGHIIVGHGKWHKKLDEYSPIMALQVAKSRAEKDSKVEPAISILPKYLKFIDRAKKYYKNCPLSANTLCAMSMAQIKQRKCKEKIERHSCGEVEEINWKDAKGDVEISAGC